MRQKIKLISTVVLCMLMVVALIGCTSTGSDPKGGSDVNTASENGGEKLQEKYTIGFIAGDIGHTFHIRTWKTVKVRAAELGMDVVVLDSKRDLATESSNVDTLLSMNVDAVMIMPCNMEGSVPAFNKVIERGIPVLAVVDQAAGMTYVGSDLVGGGGAEISFGCLTEDLGGQGNVVYIKGGAGVEIQRLRTEGVYRVMDKNPDLKIVFEQHGDWARTSGATLMQDALAAYPNKGDINAVFADDDVMSLGALEVIKAAGRLGEPILIYGCCGDGGFLEAIKSGEASMTAFQNGELIGCKATETIYRMLKGEKVDSVVNVDWDVITKDNVQAYLDRWITDEGYYTILDEYRTDMSYLD